MTEATDSAALGPDDMDLVSVNDNHDLRPALLLLTAQIAAQLQEVLEQLTKPGQTAGELVETVLQSGRSLAVADARMHNTLFSMPTAIRKKAIEECRS